MVLDGLVVLLGEFVGAAEVAQAAALALPVSDLAGDGQRLVARVLDGLVVLPEAVVGVPSNPHATLRMTFHLLAVYDLAVDNFIISSYVYRIFHPTIRLVLVPIQQLMEVDDSDVRFRVLCSHGGSPRDAAVRTRVVMFVWALLGRRNIGGGSSVGLLLSRRTTLEWAVASVRFCSWHLHFELPRLNQ